MGNTTLYQRTQWLKVSTAIVDAFDVHAPKREIIVSKRRKPSVTQETRLLMKQRDQVFKRASASGMAEDAVRSQIGWTLQ